MFEEFRIHFDTGQYSRWRRAVNGVIEETRRQGDKLPRTCAMDYAQLVVRNIMNQKHMSGYAPYVARYAKWKEQFARAHGYWQLFGDLVRNITQFRVLTGRKDEIAWLGGIPANVKDSGGKSWLGKGDRGRPKPIAMYGRIMEYGGSYGRGGNHPPRPIFQPTADEYASAGWEKRTEDSLKAIADKWR